MLVTPDTMILVWGIRGARRPDRGEREERAAAFFERYDASGDELVLTTPVVAEYLVGLDDDRRRRELEELAGAYRVLPFDLRVAGVAAKIRGDRAFLRGLNRDPLRSRVCLKADILIVATALAHGVRQIVSEDAGVHAIARRCGLAVRGLAGADPPGVSGDGGTPDVGQLPAREEE